MSPKELEEASDPETTFERLYKLSWSSDCDVRRALVDNPSIAVNEDGVVTNEILLRLAEEFPGEVACCSAFALFGLELKEKIMWDVTDVIAGKSKDPAVLTLLFHEFGPDDADIRWRIAKNPNTSQDLLRFMTDKNNEPVGYVQEAVAMNPNTAQSDLRLLANKEIGHDSSVRQGVAQNPNTPEDLLRFLADKTNEPSANVRASVARNLRTPMDVLKFLAINRNEPVDHVRHGVALNPNTPQDVLRFMSDFNNEPDPYVRNAARGALKDRGLL